MQWLKSHVLTISVFALVVFGAVAIYTPKTPVGQAVIATQAPALKMETRVPAKIKTGSVMAFKASAKKKVALPDAIAADPNKLILDSSLVKANTHDTQVTTLIDTATGEPMTLTERLPSPWLAPNTHGSLWIGAVQHVHGGGAVEADLQQSLFAIKDMRFTGRVTGSVPMTTMGHPDASIGIGGRVDW